jgi:hypothetical protein
LEPAISETGLYLEPAISETGLHLEPDVIKTEGSDVEYI